MNISCVIFNGFSAFSFRWTFILVPIIAAGTGKGISYYGLEKNGRIEKLLYILLFALINLAIIIAYYYNAKINDIEGQKNLLFYIIIFAINIVYFMIFMSSKIPQKIATLSLLSIAFFEIVYNGYVTVNERSLISQSQKDTLPLYGKTGEIIEYIEKIDNEFYRLYKKYDATELNDALAFNYNSEKYYSSSLTEPYYNLKSVFSLEDRGANYFYGFNDRQVLRDITVSKYMVSKEKREYYGYKFLKEIDNLYLYQNENSLPFGIFYDAYIDTDDLKNLIKLRNKIFYTRHV